MVSCKTWARLKLVYTTATWLCLLVLCSFSVCWWYDVSCMTLCTAIQVEHQQHSGHGPGGPPLCRLAPPLLPTCCLFTPQDCLRPKVVCAVRLPISCMPGCANRLLLHAWLLRPVLTSQACHALYYCLLLHLCKLQLSLTAIVRQNLGTYLMTVLQLCVCTAIAEA